MRISDGSSDVCSSDHPTNRRPKTLALVKQPGHSKMACLRHRLSCGSDSQETDRRRTRPMTMPLGELTQRQEMSDDPSNISSSIPSAARSRLRSEERREGDEGVGTGITRGGPNH